MCNTFGKLFFQVIEKSAKLCKVQKHTKIYFDYFGYDKSDFIPCEVCGSKAVDIHHIKPRGMGGTRKPDRITNLMALCRICHAKYGDNKQWVEYLQNCHNIKIDKG